MAIERKIPSSNSENTRQSASVAQSPLKPERILRMPDMIALTGLRKSAIDYKSDEKSKRNDPTFPRKLKIGAAAIGFRHSDAVAWINSLKTTREGGAK